MTSQVQRNVQWNDSPWPSLWWHYRRMKASKLAISDILHSGMHPEGHVLFQNWNIPPLCLSFPTALLKFKLIPCLDGCIQEFCVEFLSLILEVTKTVIAATCCVGCQNFEVNQITSRGRKKEEDKQITCRWTFFLYLWLLGQEDHLVLRGISRWQGKECSTWLR